MQAMRSTILHLLLREADAGARRLVRRWPGLRDEIEDIRQELFADLLLRLPAFDAKRGHLGAFAGCIIANQASRIAKSLHWRRSALGDPPVSLDDPHPSIAGATLGDSICDEQGYGALFGQITDPIADVDRRLDLSKGMQVLSAADREICASLAHGTIKELVQSGVGTRSALYRRVCRIRLDLTAVGLGGGV